MAVKTITIRQVKTDADFKGLLTDLRTTNTPENLYYGKSESDIAKQILLQPLIETHRRIISEEVHQDDQGT